MFKLVALLALFVVVNAGLIGHGAIGHDAYIAHAAPIAFVHHDASSYANHNSISLHPVPIAVPHAAPIVHAAPIAHFGISHGHGHHGW